MRLQQAYRRIIKILPKNTLAREKLLEIFTKNGARAEVVNLMMELCSVAESEGNTPKTIEYLEKLISLDPTNRSHSTKLALFLNERGLKDKSVEIFYQLARDYFREEHFEEAWLRWKRFAPLTRRIATFPSGSVRFSRSRERLRKPSKHF